MAESDKMKQGAGVAAEAAAKPLFKTSRSAAELAMNNAEGYAEPGLAEHRSAGGKHLEGYWFRGSGGLRPQGEDHEEEQARLRELEQRSQKGLMHRAMGAMGGMVAAVASTVMPGRFKATKSAAELASADAEGYAEPGLAEHKNPEGKYLEQYWHRGSGGLRPEGEDLEEEEARLHELEQRSKAGEGGMVQRAKDTVAAASEKAGDMLQAAKEMVGMAEPKK